MKTRQPTVFPSSGMGPLIAGLRLPDAARDGLIEALPDARKWSRVIGQW
ncbi:MAG: hypothetical protein MUF04_01415 [Akkermansiaceae bacterium]|nr:hypothetical protein [Akkermansiaceae bacterium]